MNLWLPGEQKAGVGIVREFGMDMYTLLYWDNQQGPPAWYRVLCSVLCGSLDGRGVWGRMDACICMTESLCSPHETLTTLLIGYQFSSVRSLSHLQLFATPWTAARQASVHHQLPEFTQTHVHWVGDAIQPSHPLSSPSLPALNLSQHQGLFKWVHSSDQVAKGLEFQLQHQSFQWIFRTDFL